MKIKDNTIRILQQQRCQLLLHQSKSNQAYKKHQNLTMTANRLLSQKQAIQRQFNMKKNNNQHTIRSLQQQLNILKMSLRQRQFSLQQNLSQEERLSQILLDRQEQMAKTYSSFHALSSQRNQLSTQASRLTKFQEQIVKQKSQRLVFLRRLQQNYKKYNDILSDGNLPKKQHEIKKMYKAIKQLQVMTLQLQKKANQQQSEINAIKVDLSVRSNILNQIQANINIHINDNKKLKSSSKLFISQSQLQKKTKQTYQNECQSLFKTISNLQQQIEYLLVKIKEFQQQNVGLHNLNKRLCSDCSHTQKGIKQMLSLNKTLSQILSQIHYEDKQLENYFHSKSGSIYNI